MAKVESSAKKKITKELKFLLVAELFVVLFL